MSDLMMVDTDTKFQSFHHSNNPFLLGPRGGLAWLILLVVIFSFNQIVIAHTISRVNSMMIKMLHQHPFRIILLFMREEGIFHRARQMGKYFIQPNICKMICGPRETKKRQDKFCETGLHTVTHSQPWSVGDLKPRLPRCYCN